jgi:hypothetical protein
MFRPIARSHLTLALAFGPSNMPRKLCAIAAL